MAKDTQRRFLGRDQQAHERGNGGFHLFQRKETTGQTDQDRVSEDSGIKTSGLESMAEPRLEDDAETSKSTVHEAGGLERMMDDLVMSAPTVDAQNQLALLLLTYYRGIDTGRKMEQAKAEGKQTA